MNQCLRMLFAATALTGLWLASADIVQAQQRYQPSRPTVSPYLNLFRENNGVIPNYQSLVRPQQQQYELNRHQNQLLRQQGRELQQLQTHQADILKGQTGAATQTGKGAWFGRSGSQSTFQNTAGYYAKAGAPK